MTECLSPKRIRLHIAGIVQGVGFRPFVYQKASFFNLSGFVCNTGEGVTIELQGKNEDIEQFLLELQTPPPLARIDSIKMTTITLEKSRQFSIKASKHEHSNTMLPLDSTLCDVCLEEMLDPNNRRYHYPFINCTHCGPRYTIIKALPYDRAQTSMASFSMCPSCEAEYKDPTNRRYHAQAISCFECGPTLYMLDNKGNKIAKEVQALEHICDMIKAGETVAIKGLGGFHLVCDATNQSAVQMLRKNKQRPTKPFAVMFPNLDSINRVSQCSLEDEALISSKERPIVLVAKKNETVLAPAIAPNINTIGVFLPYTPLHRLLLEKLDIPLVATSANLSDEPIVFEDETLLKKLPHFFSALLSHDRAIVNACDDSVVMNVDKRALMLRMARGFAPKSIPLASASTQKILAVGAHQKSTMALAFDEHMMLSPHMGDLNSIEAFEFFERTLAHFKEFYDFKPTMLVCDMHPEYATTQWVRQQLKDDPSLVCVQVQHHYAHALACMAEYGLDEEVLAFCFDGTGYGSDKTLWGAEVLLANPLSHKRIKHLKQFKLLGAQKAIKEPRRVALSLLFELFTLKELLLLEHVTVQSFTPQEITTLHAMWEQDINAPLTSSIGRMFDAVASLSGIKQLLDHEGESGMLLEVYAKDIEVDQPFTLVYNEESIDHTLMLKEILSCDDAHIIAARFIATIASLIMTLAKAHPKLPVVLSGGVFQNRLLLLQVTRDLQAAGIRYYIQQTTPVNDGGIALGQLYHALHLSRKNHA